MNTDGSTKKGLGKWFWIAIFSALAALHFAGWYRTGDTLELVRAAAFALLLPHSWFFPAWPRADETNTVKHSGIRYVTLSLWFVGLATLVYALVRSWI